MGCHIYPASTIQATDNPPLATDCLVELPPHCPEEMLWSKTWPQLTFRVKQEAGQDSAVELCLELQQ